MYAKVEVFFFLEQFGFTMVILVQWAYVRTRKKKQYIYVCV